MSIKVMSQVWDHSVHRGSALLLMLALADHASDDGVCWPGIDRLGRYVRVRRRYTRRLIEQAEASGELYTARNKGRGNTNLYYVTIGRDLPEMMRTLVKRLGVDPTEAEAVAKTIYLRRALARQPEKEGLQTPILSEDPEGKEGQEDHKGGDQEQKGAASTEKGGEQTPRTIMNPEDGNRQESVTDLDEETREWIAELEAQEAPERPSGRTTEELLEGARQAEAAWIARLQTGPHLLWGADSEAADRALASLDGEADQVRWLGFEIERVFGLIPDWTTPKAVRFWITSLFDCLKAAEYDPEIVIEAGQRLRADGCTLARPKSFLLTTTAIVAERRGGKHGDEHARGDGPHWTDEDIARANAAAADALDQ